MPLEAIKLDVICDVNRYQSHRPHLIKSSAPISPVVLLKKMLLKFRMNKKLLIINTFPREDTEESIMDESMGARWTE